MKFSAKIFLAIAVLAASAFTSGACENQDHDHDHEDNVMPNGLSSSEEHRRRLLDDTESGPMVRCGTPDMTPQEMSEVSAIIAEWKLSGRRLQTDPFNIPLYYHVVSNGVQGTAVTDAQLVQQTQVLNDLFAPDFTFSVQGIDKTVNSTWFSAIAGSAAELDMKRALRQGGKDALNIYFSAPRRAEGDTGLLGAATQPYTVNFTIADSLANDGVVVSFATVPGGTNVNFNEGKTAVHEAAHWIGLFHPFGDLRFATCDPNGDGDFVADTPVQLTPSFGCPIGKDSCPGQGGAEDVTNFMDYSDDSCLSTFSNGQIALMRFAYPFLRLSTDVNVLVDPVVAQNAGQAACNLQLDGRRCRRNDQCCSGNCSPTRGVCTDRPQNAAQAACDREFGGRRRCRRNDQCCSGRCSNRLCVPV